MYSTAVETPESIARIQRDVLASAKRLGPREARYLVDVYYQVQQARIAQDAQFNSAFDGDEPYHFMSWVSDQHRYVEQQIKNAMQKYAQEHLVGRWLMSITGIGPVFAAGLMAHIDIEKAPYPSSLIRYVGYDPSREWLGRAKSEELMKDAIADTSTDVERVLYIAQAVNTRPVEIFRKAEMAAPDFSVDDIRATIENLGLTHAGRQQLDNLFAEAVEARAYPDHVLTYVCEKLGISRVAVYEELYAEAELDFAKLRANLAKPPHNAALKRLCFLIGESFIKTSGREGSFYGPLYAQYKVQQIERNEAGEFAHIAEEKLKRAQSAEWRATFQKGMLPAGLVHARSRRWVTMLFLSHVHTVFYEAHYGRQAPKPWSFDFGGHRHYIAPPNWDFNAGGMIEK